SEYARTHIMHPNQQNQQRDTLRYLNKNHRRSPQCCIPRAHRHGERNSQYSSAEAGKRCKAEGDEKASGQQGQVGKYDVEIPLVTKFRENYSHGFLGSNQMVSPPYFLDIFSIVPSMCIDIIDAFKKLSQS